MYLNVFILSVLSFFFFRLISSLLFILLSVNISIKFLKRKCFKNCDILFIDKRDRSSGIIKFLFFFCNMGFFFIEGGFGFGFIGGGVFFIIGLFLFKFFLVFILDLCGGLIGFCVDGVLLLFFIGVWEGLSFNCI